MTRLRFTLSDAQLMCLIGNCLSTITTTHPPAGLVGNIEKRLTPGKCLDNQTDKSNLREGRLSSHLPSFPVLPIY